ncbi:MAG TPA: electron transfer flavoprotein subunit beta/FixA family protein [Candidatus Thermoplasmatota archaeon]|nr:electron transfer flavoprotein subunit beta/FixA family protein [Candidatus Thermoplasmatota archaeon]
MEIVVCVKRVPEISAGVRIKPDGTDIERAGLAYDLNDFDAYALEESLRLKEKHGGSVTVVTVGPPEWDETLRACLAKGADRAVRAWDTAVPGSDGIAIARLLSAAIRKQPFDLVLCGVQAEDDDAGVVGPALAEFLGAPCATIVTKVDWTDKKLTVHRELEGGVNEIVEVQTPAVLTIQTGLNEPRLAALKGILAAKSKPIQTYDLATLGVERALVGSEGAKTRVVKLLPPPAGEGATILEGSEEEAAKKLVALLRDKGHGRRA